MKIKQLSVFVQNSPGHLSGPCQALSDANVNILTMSLAETTDFGILRMIIHDWEGAKKTLEDSGYLVRDSDVVAVSVDDRPGGLASVLNKMDEEAVNIEYVYAFTYQKEKRGVLVFCFDDNDKAISAIEGTGSNVIGPNELYGMLEG